MVRRIVVPGIVVAVLCSGCAAAEKKPPYPDDPLLVTRKPVEGNPQPARLDLLASVEPLAPPLPMTLLAAAPRGDRPPLIPSSETKGTLAARPAEDGAPSGVLRALPAVRRRVVGTFGQAADSSWLQGVLERSPTGFLQLRYAEANPADSQAGVVMLNEDPRLRAFQIGDIVMIEGERAGPGRYRVHFVWLVKRGD